MWVNPILTGLGHVTLIYGLILPMAGRNRVKKERKVIGFHPFSLMIMINDFSKEYYLGRLTLPSGLHSLMTYMHTVATKPYWLKDH